MTLPLFPRTNKIGYIVLLGERVNVHTTQTDSHLNAPCLYEFSVWKTVKTGDILCSIYIGLASRGIGRPIEKYQKNIANLRENRHRGIRSGKETKWPYKTRSPWGFRWVHHELESVLHKNIETPTFKVELCIQPLAPELEKSALSAAESQAITAWKGFDAVVCMNGRPSIENADPTHLDAAWRDTALRDTALRDTA